MIYPHKVTCTVNGVAVKMNQGTSSFQDIVAQAKLPTAKSITVVSTPSKASTIAGNDSYVIDGGEVLTIA